jgi:hypothetical protein
VGSDDRPRLGSSGIFKIIANSAQKLKRAISDGDSELPPAAEDFGATLAQAFVGDQIGDVHAMSTRSFQERNPRAAFVDRWSAAVAERGPLTQFEVQNAGKIELQYIPGLEDVPQEQFVAFLEIVFGSASVPVDDEKAFAVGVVVLIDDGQLRVGAIHAR